MIRFWSNLTENIRLKLIESPSLTKFNLIKINQRIEFVIKFTKFNAQCDWIMTELSINVTKFDWICNSLRPNLIKFVIYKTNLIGFVYNSLRPNLIKFVIVKTEFTERIIYFCRIKRVRYFFKITQEYLCIFTVARQNKKESQWKKKTYKVFNNKKKNIRFFWSVLFMKRRRYILAPKIQTTIMNRVNNDRDEWPLYEFQI